MAQTKPKSKQQKPLVVSTWYSHPFTGVKYSGDQMPESYDVYWPQGLSNPQVQQFIDKNLYQERPKTWGPDRNSMLMTAADWREIFGPEQWKGLYANSIQPNYNVQLTYGPEHQQAVTDYINQRFHPTPISTMSIFRPSFENPYYNQPQQDAAVAGYPPGIPYMQYENY